MHSDCVPRVNAVFPYWHEFEPQERTHALGVLEDRVYGISDQQLVSRSANGAQYAIKLRQLDRPITVKTAARGDGRCVAIAHARIDGIEDAELTDAYAQLDGIASVDYIELHGRDPTTGVHVAERIKP